MSLWKRPLIIAAVGFAIIVVAPCLLLCAYVCSTSYFYESPSPTGLGNAIFYEDGGYNPDAPNIRLIVQDHRLSGGAIQNIGCVDNAEYSRNMQDAVWSRDGSIIAVRSLGKRVPYSPANPWTDKYGPGKWQVAYDFQQHKRIEWNKVEAALRARGGIEQKALVRQEFRKVARHTYLWEAFKFQ